MKTPPSLRSLALCGVLGVALSALPAFGITREEFATLRSKAESGNGIAQYNLGLLYATVGDEMADPIEAYVWLNLAADNGATGRALVLLNSQLSAEQLYQAKLRLEARRTELAAKRISAANPVSAPAASPIESPRSPISAAAEVAPALVAAGSPESAALQAELKKMSTELAAIWKENDQLRATAEKAAAEAEAARKERDQSTTASGPINEELARLRAASANFEGERNALQQKLETAEKSARDAVATELAQAKSQVAAAEKQAGSSVQAAAALADARRTVAELTERVRTLTADGERLTAAVAQAKTADAGRAQLERELEATTAQLTQVRAQLSNANAQAQASARLQQQLEQTQGELTQARAQLASAGSQAESASQLQRQLETAQAELTQARAQLASAGTEAQASTRLQQQLEQTQAELAQAQSQLASAGSQAESTAQLQAQLEETEVKLEAALRSFDLQQQEVAKLQAALANIDGEREGLAAQLAQLKTTATKAEEEKAQIARELAAAKAAPGEQATRFAAEVKDARDRLAAAEQALARSREDRQRSVDEARLAAQQENDRLSAELQNALTGANQLTAALRETTAERDQLQQQLASQPATPTPDPEAGALQARLAAAQNALAAANSEKATLADELSALREAASTAGTAAASTAPAPDGVASATDDTELRNQLQDTESKLTAALRTYQLQQEQIDRLQSSLANIDTEREQLADRLETANRQIADVTTQATTNQDAANQLTAIHEQLRQAQNQIASLAGENAQLKSRIALAAPAPAPAPAVSFSPTRPASTPTTAVLSQPTRPSATPATASTGATTAAPVSRTHTVAAGETLSRIARRYYGSSERWREILDANRAVIRDPNNLSVGTTLRVP